MTLTPNSPFAPLPGTEPATRALFVDRWGTLLELPAASAPRFDPEKIFPGAVDALFRAQQAGWQIYLIGNEPAVATGRWSDAAWERFEAALLEHLAAMGVDVVRNYACLDHPEEGHGAHQKPSVFLLPDTGLLYHASQNDGVALSSSWVLGDSSLELTAGGRAGCGTVGVQTGLAFQDGGMQVEPDVVVENLAEALELLVQAVART
jgi:histidinol phosphatase-like enzyme